MILYIHTRTYKEEKSVLSDPSEAPARPCSTRGLSIDSLARRRPRLRAPCTTRQIALCIDFQRSPDIRAQQQGERMKQRNCYRLWLALLAVAAVFSTASTPVLPINQVPPGCSIAHDASALGVDGGFDSTASWSHTTAGTNKYLVVGLAWGDDVLVSSVSYGGIGMSSIGAAQYSSSGKLQLFGLVNPASGANTVAVTWSGATLHNVGSVSFTCVHQTTPTGTFASATGNGLTATVDVASAAGDIVVDVLAWGAPSDADVGANQTVRWSGGDGSSSTEPATGATTTMSWSWTWFENRNWAVGGVAVKPAP